MFGLGRCDVDAYVGDNGDNGDNADADEEDEESQADD
jgi:hypothetical protein